jgi:hypothetical protein
MLLYVPVLILFAMPMASLKTDGDAGPRSAMTGGGPDYQVVYLAALRVEQAGLVRGDDEMHPVPGA